jgi:hypothetical protein
MVTDVPDIRFLGFDLWIDGWQFPDSADYWDSNWLLAHAAVEVDGASVRCAGAFLTTIDIARFRAELATMIFALKGEAVLASHEPYLQVQLKMTTLGHVDVSVEITPDHLWQKHHFLMAADQSYLPRLVSSLDTILARFPVRNSPGRS